MKKTAIALLTVALSVLLMACGAKASEPTSTEVRTLPTEKKAQYGALQEIVDIYGFPIHFRMTEGMELTEIVIDKESAKREWMSSLNGSTLHENLSWSITGSELTVSGQWEDVFTINVTTGRALSQADGKEYRIVTYDKDGEVAFQVD